MMKIAIVFLLSIFIISCVSFPKKLKHEYKIQIVDTNNNPIENADIEYKIYQGYESTEKLVDYNNIKSDRNGFINISLDAYKFIHPTKKKRFRDYQQRMNCWYSRLELVINKVGHNELTKVFNCKNEDKYKSFGEFKENVHGCSLNEIIVLESKQ